MILDYGAYEEEKYISHFMWDKTSKIGQSGVFISFHFSHTLSAKKEQKNHKFSPIMPYPYPISVEPMRYEQVGIIISRWLFPFTVVKSNAIGDELCLNSLMWIGGYVIIRDTCWWAEKITFGSMSWLICVNWIAESDKMEFWWNVSTLPKLDH